MSLDKVFGSGLHALEVLVPIWTMLAAINDIPN